MKESSPFPWVRFVALCGAEGRSWAEDYRRGMPAMQLCQDAVAAAQRRRSEEARTLLERAWEDLRTLRGFLDPSVCSVVERWYYGARGFYLYAREAFDEADCTMARAQGTVAEAIERKRWLVPLALDCYELELHRARIARERQHWARMREHAEKAWRMRDGRLPFCSLRDGTSLGLAELQRFYRSVPEAPPEDQAAVEPIMDDHQSRLNAERATWYVFRLPGFVIQYP